MAIQLIDGDYQNTPDHRLTEVHGMEELLQNVRIALQAKRKRFYPDKDFGSRISTATHEPLAEYITAYACQALERTDGAYVIKSEITGSIAAITVLLNSQERQVSINLND